MQTFVLISFLINSINTRILSAYLKQHGFEVVCIFCPKKFNKKNIESLIHILRAKNILLVGISLVTDDYQPAVIVTQIIKSDIGVPVIWGGAHVNAMPDESLRHADMICCGEGEDALLELVRSMSATGKPDTSIKNIWFKSDGIIIKNELRYLEEDLDVYPYPDFDLETQFVLNEKVIERLDEKHLQGEYSIMTSRGCPYRCDYCYNSYRREQYKGKGQYLRRRSVENVINELEKALTIFKNVNRINFWDDSFVARSTDDFRKFSELYARKIKLPFFALIEPMVFNKETIALLQKCGLIHLQIGIQSGSERVNKEVYSRPITNEKVLEIVRFVNSLGIAVTYDVIFNNPYESVEDVQETIKLLLAFPAPFNVQGFSLIFYPGTAITSRALRDGYISLKPDSEDFSTIQSKSNTPISASKNVEVSSRFYLINYTYEKKKYFNAVISLFAYRYFPRLLIKFFARSEKKYKKILMSLFSRSYIAAYETKLYLKRISR